MTGYVCNYRTYAAYVFLMGKSHGSKMANNRNLLFNSYTFF